MSISSQQHPQAKKQKLLIPDLITVGVLTAIYFVLVSLSTLISFLLLPGFANIFLPAIAALLSGSVYMLLASKVKKFGAITVMGSVMGLFFLISGHFALSFVICLVCAILADLLAKWGAYTHRGKLLLSYLVFSYGLTGPILPLWFMKDAYITSLQNRGKDAAYIERVFSHVNQLMFVLCLLSIIVGSLAGGYFGQKMLKKHFAKAGMV